MGGSLTLPAEGERRALRRTAERRRARYRSRYPWPTGTAPRFERLHWGCRYFTSPRTSGAGSRSTRCASPAPASRQPPPQDRPAIATRAQVHASSDGNPRARLGTETANPVPRGGGAIGLLPLAYPGGPRCPVRSVALLRSVPTPECALLRSLPTQGRRLAQDPWQILPCQSFIAPAHGASLIPERRRPESGLGGGELDIQVRARGPKGGGGGSNGHTVGRAGRAKGRGGGGGEGGSELPG